MSDIFLRMLDKETIYKNPDAVQEYYIPERIMHRATELFALADTVIGTLKGQRNLMVFGPSGSGKTVVCRALMQQLDAQGYSSAIKTVYINCVQANTYFRVMKEFYTSIFSRTKLPCNIDKLNKTIKNKLIKVKQTSIILFLDEIDRLIMKEGGGIKQILSYNQYLEEKKRETRISIIGISNASTVGYIATKSRTLLGDDCVKFSPYTPQQLKDILVHRAEVAFIPGAVPDDIIDRCVRHSSLAGRGDARRAINLMRIAGNIARNHDSKVITHETLDTAVEWAELDVIKQAILTMPDHYIALLCAIKMEKEKHCTLSRAYANYLRICSEKHLEILTMRRCLDIVKEFANLGIVSTRVISHGRFGRSTSITLEVSRDTISSAIRQIGGWETL